MWQWLYLRDRITKNSHFDLQNLARQICGFFFVGWKGKIQAYFDIRAYCIWVGIMQHRIKIDFTSLAGKNRTREDLFFLISLLLPGEFEFFHASLGILEVGHVQICPNIGSEIVLNLGS